MLKPEQFNKAREFEVWNGDIVLRKATDGKGYECYLIGVGMYGSGLIGEGYSPMDALRSHNYLVWNRMDEMRKAKDAAESAKRAEARKVWKRGRSWWTILGDNVWGHKKSPPRNADGTTMENSNP